MNLDYATGTDDGAITPDGLLMRQDQQWTNYRQKLEQAQANDAPLLELTIQSSATLIKGEKIHVNALGLISHESKRTNPKLGV